MTVIGSDLVAEVLDAFYVKVRQDPELGPVFAAIIGDDWTVHMEKINAFWCSALRLRSGYRGQDFMPAHVRHITIKSTQIDRWLSLFEDTLREHVPEDHRARFSWVAGAMAENLRISLERRDGAATLA